MEFKTYFAKLKKIDSGQETLLKSQVQTYGLGILDGRRNIKNDNRIARLDQIFMR